MQILNEYFNDLIFTYNETKQSYAIYVVAIHSMIGGDKCQYILAFVPDHLGIQKTSKLRDLPWKNLQTRTLSHDSYKVKRQAWKAPNHNGVDLNLKVISRDTNYSTYKADKDNFPFEILMINTLSKKTIYQYPNSMNLHYAIDQFNTIFNYIGDEHPINLISHNITYNMPKIHNNFELII